MKTYVLLFALTISQSMSQAMAQDNLEVDSMLSILAKPKLAVQIEPQVSAINAVS